MKDEENAARLEPNIGAELKNGLGVDGGGRSGAGMSPSPVLCEAPSNRAASRGATGIRVLKVNSQNPVQFALKFTGLKMHAKCGGRSHEGIFFSVNWVWSRILVYIPAASALNHPVAYYRSLYLNRDTNMHLLSRL